MMGRVLTAYGVEVTKALRQRFTALGPALVILAVLGALPVHPVARDGVSDYAFVAYVIPVALNSLGLLLLLVYCAGLVSGEVADGSIRQTLVRPILRHEYILAKLLLGMSYAVLLTLTAVITAWGIAYIFGEMRGVSFGGDLVFADNEMLATGALATLAGLAPQFAAVAFAIMVSTFTRNGATATGVTVGLWVLVDLVKYPLGMAPFVFTTYLEMPWQVFSNRCEAVDAYWQPMLYYCLACSGGTFLVCSLVAIVVFHRRNFPA